MNYSFIHYSTAFLDKYMASVETVMGECRNPELEDLYKETIIRK